MRDGKILYVILGFGCGVVLCGSIGLIASLNTDVYFERWESSDKNNQAEYDNKEYKTEQYADETKEKNSQNEVYLESEDEILNSVEVKETQEIVQAQKTDEIKEIKGVDEINESKEIETVETTSEINEQYVYVQIPSYFGATQICQLLEKENIVDDAKEFLNFIRKEGKQTMLLDGKLKLQYGLTYQEVLTILTRNN